MPVISAVRGFMGPTTLEIPNAAMNIGNFQILACLVLACLVGVALVGGMQLVKEKSEKHGN